MKLFLLKEPTRAPGGRNGLRTGSTRRQQSPPESKRLPVKIWVELLLGLMSTVLLTLAIVLPNWMELFFHRTPDAGDGSAERGFALLWAAISLLMFALAGCAWRKHLQLLRSA
jgi:hypothetical protein